MTTEAALKAWETRRRNGWVHPNAREPEPVRKPVSTQKKKLSSKQAAIVASAARRTLELRAKKAVQTRMAKAKSAKRAKKKARG